jgi:hypothetical protein
MSGEKPTQSGDDGQDDGSKASSGSPQASAVAAPGSAAAPSPRPVTRHLDVEVRAAYRETFGQDAGDITVARGLGDYRVTVRDPGGKDIPGIGQTREAAYDNLIARIKSAAPRRNS